MNKISALILAGLIIAGCNGGGGGGGGDDDGGGGGGGGTSLTLDSSPTAAFTASQTTGSALATEIQEDVPDLVALATADLPGGINTLPGGVATTMNCADLFGTGSGTYTYDTNVGSGGFTTGSTITITYNNCSYTYSGSTFTMNGTMTITYTRFVSYSDFATSTTYTNVTWSSSGPYGDYSYGPMNATYNVDYANGVYTYSHTLSNGGASDITSSDVIIGSGTVTITSATYVYTSAATGGVVRVVFDNWTYSTTTNRAVSGSITVTGANGNSVRFDATGTGYTITYTVGGTVTSYVVTY